MANKSMGACIRDIRRAEGWTSVQLGERAGLSGTYITRIERDTINSPSIDTLTRIAFALCECEVIKNRSFDLTSYDSLFVMMILYKRDLNEANNKYKYEKLSTNLQSIMDASDSIEDQVLASWGWYARRKDEEQFLCEIVDRVGEDYRLLYSIESRSTAFGLKLLIDSLSYFYNKEVARMNRSVEDIVENGNGSIGLHPDIRLSLGLLDSLLWGIRQDEEHYQTAIFLFSIVGEYLKFLKEEKTKTE